VSAVLVGLVVLLNYFMSYLITYVMLFWANKYDDDKGKLILPSSSSRVKVSQA